MKHFRFGKIIGFYVLAQMPMLRLYARLRRATVHTSVVMRGRPLIRCARGAKLILSEGVQINTSLGSNPLIGRSRSALCVVAPGAVMEIGPHVGMSGACLCSANSLKIGESTIIGADVLITDTDFHSPLSGFRWSNDSVGTSKPVMVGKGCFIGARAIILKGVTIGDGAVIAAGAVVTRDVPAGYLAFGNPASVKPLDNRWLHPSGV
jgi:acetyltransferase-like isoleucine patch superfamily enzyme